MKRAYQLFLLLYPKEHRARFAEEMTGVFEEARNQRRYQGRASYVRFFLAEVIGLVAGAVGAWFGRKPAFETSAASSAQNSLPPELIETQQMVEANVAAMLQAIANHQFVQARFHSDKERQAREHLRVLREKHGITD